ncbi:HPr family phosphocarrier protein [Ureaplasma canigenitalium]|uniref:HPr family phosphocarrier protein n=1 Tax=Ureaplasma canigenitalium TaxID=42092 RepID=UPI0004E217F3|nr:HPr family phosphocarrier protein [Ureaplasma canigenitalium]
MTSKKYTIKVEITVFIKSITFLVNVASEFSSNIKINANGHTADAKSIINVMALGIKENTEIEVIAEGDDEQDALRKIDKVLKEQSLI